MKLCWNQDQNKDIDWLKMWNRTGEWFPVEINTFLIVLNIVAEIMNYIIDVWIIVKDKIHKQALIFADRVWFIKKNEEENKGNKINLQMGKLYSWTCE